MPARLLPNRFTLTELRETYEIALGVPSIDVSSFRRKVTDLGLLQAIDETSETGGRKARLYRLREPVTLFNRRI